MIACKPRGICSSDYVLDDGSQGAVLEYGMLAENGKIQIGDKVYNIQKQGMLSGRWELKDDDTTLFTGQKSNAFNRTFEINNKDGISYSLRALSAFGRSFVLEKSDREIAKIEPVHAFTRRATIDTSEKDLLFVAFGFWLAALMWRRSEQSNS